MRHLTFRAGEFALQPTNKSHNTSAAVKGDRYERKDRHVVADSRLLVVGGQNKNEGKEPTQNIIGTRMIVSNL